MSAPASRPVHPCVLSLTEGTRGVEYSTWAHITSRLPELPNLVTASASSLSVYSLDEETGKLFLEHSFGNIAGSIVYLSRLQSSHPETTADALLVGFGGFARLTVLQVKDGLLRATSLLDLTPVLQEFSYGAVCTREQDAMISCDTSSCIRGGSISGNTSTGNTNSSRPGHSTVSAVLGGGVAVAVVEVTHKVTAGGWLADEPYIVPLKQVSQQLPHNRNTTATSTTTSATTTAATAANLGSMASGFGDILASTFLTGYLEPVLVLLHSDPGGKLWTGRMGRENDSERGAVSLHLTALSISVAHHRTALLWSLNVPSDAASLSAFGCTGCLVVGANTLVIVEAGKVQQVLACNGWARSTCPTGLLPTPTASNTNKLQSNSVMKLAIQLDGCALAWLSSQSAVLSLRSGQIYVLQKTVEENWSLLPTGQTLSTIGEVEHLSALSFDDLATLKASESSWFEDKLGKKAINMSMGILFAGSRLGDSLLLGYVLEMVNFPWNNNQEESEKPEEIKSITEKKEGPVGLVSSSSSDNKSQEEHTSNLDEAYDHVLELEEEALYAPTPRTTVTDSNANSTTHIVPPSDEEGENSEQQQEPKRPRVTKFTVVRSLTPLDALVSLGPLGESCQGPLFTAPSFMTERIETTLSNDNNSDPLCGASAYIFPCGFGSSGGVALATVPGRDDRMIVTEADCLNVDCVFSLPRAGIILLGLASTTVSGGLHSGGGGGMRALRRTDQPTPTNGKEQTKCELQEIDLNSWCSSGVSKAKNALFSTAREVFESSIVLNGAEFSDRQFALLVGVAAADTEKQIYGIVILRDNDNTVEIENQFLLESGDNGALTRATPFVPVIVSGQDALSFTCLWSSGNAKVVTFSHEGILSSIDYLTENLSKKEDAMDIDNDDEAKEVREYYTSRKIVAVDLFKCSRTMFRGLRNNQEGQGEQEDNRMRQQTPESGGVATAVTNPSLAKASGSNNDNNAVTADMTVAQLKVACRARGLKVSGSKKALLERLAQAQAAEAEAKLKAEMSVQTTPRAAATTTPTVSGETVGRFGFDEDDQELYHIDNKPVAPLSGNGPQTSSVLGGEGESDEEVLFGAVCRQSGEIEVYVVCEGENRLVLCWRSDGCGHGAAVLGPSLDVDQIPRKPRLHKVHVREMRFFFCGPTIEKGSESSALRRSFCLGIETTSGDFVLYRATHRSYAQRQTNFLKVPLRSAVRPSAEQNRHHAKLLRKGVVAKEQISASERFSHNTLHGFVGISGQDGLFAAGGRAQWIVAERGKPTVLFHRSRHAAPAGGKPRPVSGFCSGLINTSGIGKGFLTLHERVGRVGSQRLTFFTGLSSIFSSHGVLPGGGLCIEKIPMGVTVRRIQFIDSATLENDHPLYAVLVSRELEVDQSSCNSDGLSPEERQRIAEEKEDAKIKRQVEADLGGFDLESEWVEEIEREDCFKIDTDLGGAPPIRKTAYSLWIVDASNKWMVVDSFELEEYEHGLTMKVMTLSEFKEEPGTAGDSNTLEETLPSRQFIVVGTGRVDHNGEDVSSKGRVLLFEVKRLESATQLLPTSQVAELSLCYEQENFHGPVTTLNCLSTEGRNRLVMGAGADINIEQWGNGKLTQVGFFRATMHILDILLFKNFFLLSDAYDSLYFLVWRESDKSLTLLAKDYDPIPVYATGLLSRGAAMSFLCHDDRQNLQFFQYAPGEAAARGGNRLVCKSDFHLGTQTTHFCSHYCRSSLLVSSATPTSTLAALKQQDSYVGRTDDDQRLGIHFGTTDGGVGSVVPLSEPVYWRLAALQSVMSNALESDCALSRRAWRLYRWSPRRGGCRSNDRKKGVIDGDQVLEYIDLPLADQEDLAGAIGSTVDMIVDNLLELQCGSIML